MSRVLALDAHSLIFRSFHATVGVHGLEAAQPLPALRAFVAKILRRWPSEYVLACADTPGPGLRDQWAPDYKGHRQGAEGLPEFIQQSLAAMRQAGIPVHQAEGYEADDLLAALAAQLKPGHQLLLVSSDRDLAALVDEHVHLLLIRTGEQRLITPGNVQELFGVPAERICDYKALVGDASDNIPGVPGIGPKGALALLEQAPGLEQLRPLLPEMQSRPARLLEQHWDAAQLSYRLAQLYADAPMQLDAEAAQWNHDKLRAWAEGGETPATE